MATRIFQVQELVREIEDRFRSDKPQGLQIEKRTSLVQEKPPQTAELPSSVLDHIPEKVIELINRKHSISTSLDIRRDCFFHQVKALELIYQGKNVAIITPTASGKTLCYQIPILSEMVKSDESTALLIFPTNALEVDQIGSITDFGRYEQDGPLYKIDLDGKTVYAGEYLGATKEGRDQGNVRRYVRILLTNPDSIHAKILPYPAATKKILAFKAPSEAASIYSFERFLKHLRYVVLDEIHQYRGVFGANVAYVMRRLRLMCEKLGNTNIQFICCSATIANPREHAEKLVGLPFTVVVEDGSPKYRKDFLLWNPPQKSKGEKERREATTDALEIFERVIANWKTPIQTIIFLPSVKSTNTFDHRLRGMLERLNSPYKGKTVAFSRPLPTQDKRESQKHIKSGNVLFISSTSALELGIDIGDLTCCLLVGYPGNISSVLQRAGRVGRTGESLVVLMLNDNLLEQYFAKHSEVFFKLLESPGNVKIPLGNKYLLLWHLKCALWENRALKDLRKGVDGYSTKDYETYLGEAAELFEELEHGGKVYQENQVYWLTKGCGEGPDTLHRRSIRVPISDREFRVVEKRSNKEIAAIDYYRAGLFFHEGAIWLQNGEYYLVTRYSRSEALIEVEHLQDDPGYETNALPRYTIEIVAETLTSRYSSIMSLHHGDVTSRRSINIFLKNPTRDRDKTKQEVGIVTSVEPIEYDTTATWLVFEDEFIERTCREAGERIGEDPLEFFEKGLHGLSLLFTSTIPLMTECDKHDVSCQIFMSHHEIGKPTLFLLDTFHGGVGISREVFERLHRLLDLCEAMLDIPEKLTTFLFSQDAIHKIEKGETEARVENLGELVVVDKKLIRTIVRQIRGSLK